MKYHSYYIPKAAKSQYFSNIRPTAKNSHKPKILFLLMWDYKFY